MFSMPDKARMKSITELYQGPVDDEHLRELRVDNLGPLTIGEAICFIMDEPALSNRPLTVDTQLMRHVAKASRLIGTDDEGVKLRMLHLAPMLSILTRTAHVIDPGTVAVIKRGGADAHGRKRVGYVEPPIVEYVSNDDVDRHHATFSTYLQFAENGVERPGLRINRVSICIAAKAYINDVAQTLGLEVMRIERENNTMIRERLQQDSRRVFGMIEDRRNRERGVTMGQWAEQMKQQAVGPDPIFDPDGSLEEDDVLVSLDV